MVQWEKPELDLQNTHTHPRWNMEGKIRSGNSFAYLEATGTQDDLNCPFLSHTLLLLFLPSHPTL